MQALKLFFQISRKVGKTLLVLLLALIIVVALLHLPPVQKQLTHLVSDYLSSKTAARVEIDRIKFSITGEIAIEDLVVWDPQNKQILRLREMRATTHITDLISGDLTFDELHLSGLQGRLIQNEEGLNIQFILDAFSGTEAPDTNKSNPVQLQFKKIHLENILFEYISSLHGLSVTTKLGQIETTEAALLTYPFKISADQILLQETTVDVFSSQHTDLQSTHEVEVNREILTPDFGTGIAFDIRSLVFKQNNFSFYEHEVRDTLKFDPAHISLKHIDLTLSDIAIHPDTLAARLESLSAQLPGFEVANVRAAIQANQKKFVVSGFQLASGLNELRAEITAPLNLNSIKNNERVPVSIDIKGQIKPADLSYFVGDSVMKAFSHWPLTTLVFDGDHFGGKGTINTLHLKTGGSELHAMGTLYDILQPENISWKEVEMNALIGAVFKNSISPYLGTINLPPSLALQLESSGNLKKANIDAEMLTTWGNAKVKGLAGNQHSKMELDMQLIGEKVDIGKWLTQSWIGSVNLTADVKGMIGNKQGLAVRGLIADVEIQEQLIHNLTFESKIKEDSAHVAMTINDPHYQSSLTSEISFAGPLTFINDIKIDSFRLGSLLGVDSTLFLTGNTKSKLTIDHTSLEGYVLGTQLQFEKQAMRYGIDTLVAHTLFSPTKSDFTYYTENANIKLQSNFDLRESPYVIEGWSEDILTAPTVNKDATENKTATLEIDLKNASFLKLLGIDIDGFSSLRISGDYNQTKQLTALQATSGNFKGYGISLDTLHSQVMSLHDTLRAAMNIKNLAYDSIQLGNIELTILNEGDTALSNFTLYTDTTTLLGIEARIVRADSGAFVYPDKLQALNKDYLIDAREPILVEKNNLTFHDFEISRDKMKINVDGDLRNFDIAMNEVDLTAFNFLISSDTTVISKGHLNGNISYQDDIEINLHANIDSLSLFNSKPLSIKATAVSEGLQVPFDFLLNNTSNTIDLKGTYFSDSEAVDATLLMDINNPEIVEFFISDVVDKMSGSIHGKTSIRGPLQKPVLKGSIRFVDLGLTTVNPTLNFHIADDSLTLNNSSLLFNKFTLYDKEQHPLTLTGNISLADYQNLSYDLQINSQDYTLLNNPDSTSGKLRGALVIDSDIKLKGNGKDTDIQASINIDNTTDLTLVNSTSDIELLTAEGVIDFVNPELLSDTTALKVSTSLYDSLIASLPDFNLNSRITIEEKASLKLIIDERSGDYIKASGNADLELGYDRTGNLRLVGNYTIKNGMYRLSFYDLVKKNFTLAEGSSIVWHGSAKNGDVNIKATHTVASNSLGLIGHEIGENEKSIYKRSLDYEVGINIDGTIEKPMISFSLDLPQSDRTNYPVLANKLDRLRQPEYQSELNKQVFGLLVLGGFLPESSGSDINSSLIASTALSNSVNSLLASQLNRFANQYIKGVNIDVGIQSFSDYSAPGGKTQTAMDFRVSKKVMNDRLSFEIGGDFDISQDQSGANTGKNYRGDIAIIYDLTGNGDKQLKLFNNETYDIIYQEIRNTGISLIFIREFENKEAAKKKGKNK